MRNNETVPLEVAVSADRIALSIAWADGHESRYGATQLRRACRSSNGIRTRINGDFLDDNVPTHITAVKPVGHYAINLVFSDGHDRGIYPWSYLRELDKTRPEA